MAIDLEKKDIRSDKVRKIIGEEPPLIIRYGNIIISIVLVTIEILMIIMYMVHCSIVRLIIIIWHSG